MLARLYLRASTADQDATRARDMMRTFARERGLRIAATYVENESGATLQHGRRDAERASRASAEAAAGGSRRRRADRRPIPPRRSPVQRDGLPGLSASNFRSFGVWPKW
jgi:hypothetical protein